nr:hypothetical protein [Nocardioides marinisabuli]
MASGPGRVLVAVYGVLGLAATGRSTVQLLGQPEEAPLAYSLSLLAAVIYLVATASLLRSTPRARLVGLVACSVEAVGVLAVGVLTYTAPDLFPDKTVWSHFGQGYAFLPLVLPFLGLAWLRRTSLPVSG